MNIRKLGSNELADLALKIIGLLSGTDLTAIDSHVRADLITAIGTKPADLIAQATAAQDVDVERKTAFSLRDLTTSEIVTWINRVRDALKSGIAPIDQFNMCGLDYPGVRSGKYVALDPTKMTVAGFSNGINKGEFQGNNRNGRVVYEIWRREGDSGTWHKHLLTKKQTFTDRGVTPGQYYEYRVKAVATQTESNFSNSAVVYGVL